jgi:hypothetical protein
MSFPSTHLRIHLALQPQLAGGFFSHRRLTISLLEFCLESVLFFSVDV